MQWNTAQKVGFRFLTCYILLYTMSSQFLLSFVFDALWKKIVPWFAEYILHLSEPITVFANGSGDTTYNYVCILLYVIISLIATIVWSILDKDRPHYKKALELLIVLVRYYLIFQMLVYGLAKIYYVQFRPPSFERLLQTYGNSSPMGLLWTFMGYSQGYTMFGGFAEFIGGILLLFRRFRTLGALVVFGVMVNVMALNYFYDVPVKLLSTHIVLLSIFLIALDANRLWKFFITNEPVQPRPVTPFFANSKNSEFGKNILKWIAVIGGIGAMSFFVISNMMKSGIYSPKPPLYGLYEIETFERNSEEILPIMTDSTRWRYLIVERKDRATVKMMNDKRINVSFVPDSNQSSIIYFPLSDSNLVDTFRYTRIDSTHFRLEGIQKEDTLNILMKRKTKDDFQLINRGFNWINERPLNQ